VFDRFLTLPFASRINCCLGTFGTHTTKPSASHLDMPHQKKPRLLDDRCVSAGDLSTDVLANVLGYLDGPKDIMQKRRVCKKWGEAVKKTIIPPADFCVNSMKSYNVMIVMARAMPNLQQITIGGLGSGHKWSDGEDPNEELAATTADYTAHDIRIISNFSKLRVLEISYACLNGRYPFLFSSFPLLQKLSIKHCYNLNWDLEMLAGFPLLKDLACLCNYGLTGNIGSLRVLKDALEEVAIISCKNVKGNFMDVADFPHLKELNLDETDVTGDIRDMSESDFSSLECLCLPKTVYGGNYYEFQHISDGHDLVRALYLFNKKRPVLKMEDWNGELSEDSPDWYDSVDEDYDTTPFYIRFVKAGSRIGFRWVTEYENPCEVNWLDPVPDRESDGYEEYIERFQEIENQVKMYKGFHQPPTEEEYHRLIQKFYL
jgi:hypothetical protein